jgi:hypothetical protein
VKTTGPDPARRALGFSRSAPHVRARYLDVHVQRQHYDIGDRQKQQLLQPEHEFFRGPELSATTHRPPSARATLVRHSACTAHEPCAGTHC